MEVSLYPHLEEFRDAFHTIDLETIMIHTLKIHEMLISSRFLCNSIGSIHMVQNGNPFSPKIQLLFSMDVSLCLHLQKFRGAFYTIDLETIVIYNLKEQETI